MKRIFPLVDRISDAKLKNQTVSCWEEAVKRGGWTRDNLHHIPFTLLPTEFTPSIVAHTNGVVASALALSDVINENYGGKIRLDMDVLISGAILHDVGKVLEYEKIGDKYVKSKLGKLVRHPVSGAALAWDMGLPPEVVHVIASHSYEGDKTPRSPEAVLVHHADFANFEVLGGKA